MLQGQDGPATHGQDARATGEKALHGEEALSCRAGLATDVAGLVGVVDNLALISGGSRGGLRGCDQARFGDSAVPRAARPC